jgi:hypothetical protein
MVAVVVAAHASAKDLAASIAARWEDVGLRLEQAEADAG